MKEQIMDTHPETITWNGVEYIKKSSIAEMPTEEERDILAVRLAECYLHGDMAFEVKRAFISGWDACCIRMRDCESKCLLNYSFKECKYTEPKHEACKYCDKFRNRMKGGEK
jgi:hypothetical protein